MATQQRVLHPVLVWLTVLVIVLAAEYALMLLLPGLLPDGSSRLIEAAVDAFVLTLVLAPVLWWTVVRPLNEMIRIRTQFLADLFAHTESENRRMAIELHDGVGQALTLLISGMRSAKACRATEACTGRMEGFQQLAENALAEVRRLALGLRPSLLDDLGLAPALERLVEDMRVHHPAQIDMNVDEMMGMHVPEPAATAVFRIVQEALANILKHSQAQHAAIALRRSPREVILEVIDDGCGIARERLDALPPGHLGLRGMRERAVLLGGSLTVDSTPGQGTRLTARIPVEGEQHGQGATLAGRRS